MAPDQPNLRENIVAGATGLLFEAGNVEALAAKLRQVVSDRAAAVRIGAAGRSALLRAPWTWAGNADRVVAIYEDLAGGAA